MIYVSACVGVFTHFLFPVGAFRPRSVFRGNYCLGRTEPGAAASVGAEASYLPKLFQEGTITLAVLFVSYSVIQITPTRG